MTFETVANLDSFNTLKEKTPAVLFYYSHKDCGVCQVLKPKIAELFAEYFPEVKLKYVDVKATPDVAAQNSVLTVPTMDIFLEGQSFMRESRHISVGALKERLERPYHLLFDEL